MDSNAIDTALLSGLIKELPGLPWREVFVERMMTLHLRSGDTIEYRLVSGADKDIFGTARRAADSFFTAFSLYPTMVVVHPTVAALFEASEFVIKAEHGLGTAYRKALLRGFVPPPLHVESDESLDTRTVAVRFTLRGEEYREAMNNVLLRTLGQGGGQ